jgi:hypothetical protein
MKFIKAFSNWSAHLHKPTTDLTRSNRALALIGSPGRQQLVFLDVPMHN